MSKRTNTHPADIKCAIQKAGSNMTKLGHAYGVKPNTVRKSLHVCCPQANRAIADFLGTTVHALWPEWFGPDGERLLPISTKKSSSGRTAGHCQNAEAA